MPPSSTVRANQSPARRDESDAQDSGDYTGKLGPGKG